MKTSPRIHRSIPFVLVGTLAALLSVHAAKATSLYWDTNGATAGSGASLTGTWGYNNFWTADSSGLAAPSAVTTTSSDLLYITVDPSTVRTGSDTITVSGTQSAEGIAIQSGSNALTFAGGQINLGDGGISVPQYAIGTKVNISQLYINSFLNLTANQTWTNNSASGIYINTGLTGAGNLTLTGNATSKVFSFGGTQLSPGDFSGWTGNLAINGGSLLLNTSKVASAVLGSGRTLTLQNGAAQTYLSFAGMSMGSVTHIASNIVFDSSTVTSYIINWSTGGTRGSVISFDGTISGTSQRNIIFSNAAVDLSGTGQKGVFRISGNNTGLTILNGNAITVQNGYLYLDSANALGTGNSLAFNLGSSFGAGLYASSGNNVSGSITLASALADTYIGLDGAGAVSYTGKITLTAVSGTSTLNNLHLRAMAGGTSTFTGSIVDSGANTYDIPVIVDGGGTVVLAGTASTYSGKTYVNAGTLQLDFSQGSVTSNLVNSTANNSALVVGGGRLNVVGKTGAANSQRFNGTTVNAGASTIQLSATTSNSVALTLGALSRIAGGTVDFVLPAGTQSATNGISTSSISSVSNGVLVSAASNGIAYATVGGSDWAALSGSNIIALSSYNPNSYTSTDNTDVTSNATVSAASTVNTLRFNNATARTVTLSGLTTVSTGGILVTATAASGATITGGSLQAGAGSELVVINNGGNFAINSAIVDSASGTSGLTVSGPGVTTLGGINTYSGTTAINAGTVSVSSTAALGTGTSAIILGDSGHKATLSYTGASTAFTRGISVGASGAELDVTTAGATLTISGTVAYQANPVTGGTAATYGNFTIGGAGNVTISTALNLGFGGLIMNGTGLLTLSGSNLYSGETVINSGTVKLGSIATDLSPNSPVTVNGGTLDLNGITASIRGATMTLNGGVIQNGALKLADTTLFVTSGTVTAALTTGSGDSVTGSLYKTGTGTLYLANASNSFAGATYVNGGTLQYGSNDAIGTGSLVISNATVDMGGYTDTVGGLVMDSGTLAGTTASALTSSTSFAFTNSGYVSANLKGTGIALIKSGTGTVTLSGSNSYTGATTINDGKLAVNGRITSSAVTVNSGGILGGSGTIGGSVSVLSGGHFAPGNSISTTFSTGALTLAAGSITDIELGNATGAGTRGSPWLSDRTTISGSLILGGTLNLINNAGALTSAGSAGGSIAAGSYLIFTGATGAVGGSYSDIVNVSGYHAKVDSTTTAGSVYVDNYQIATANTQPATVNLGITHVGGSFTNTALNIQNTGTNNGFSEGLNATKGATTGAATLVGGDISNLAGGATSTAITVGLNDTATVGAKTGTATVGFASNGSTTSGYGTTSAGSQTVTVNGQVNYYADPTLTAVSGGNLTSADATHYTLSLGSFNLNTGEYTATISLNNFLHDATYQDILSGTFDTTRKGLFSLEGFDGTLTAIASGTNVTLTVSFDTTGVAQGDYEGTIVFHPTSANASGTSSLNAVSLGLEFTVVPEPATWAMVVGGMGMLAFGQRARRRCNG